MAIKLLSILIKTLYVIQASAALTVPCQPRESQFAPHSQLLHQIVIVGKDDRTLRNPGQMGANVEASQGRFWCFDKKLDIPTDEITKEVLSRNAAAVANASLVFDDDVALVNRHNFIDENGKKVFSPSNCVFEHIPSKTFARVVDSEFNPYRPHRATAAYYDDDAALIRLERSFANSSIKKKDILIEENIDMDVPITIVSNYARNLKRRDALTITNCVRKVPYAANGSSTNLYGTDCDTGHGSSGAQGWVDFGGRKLLGIVTGQSKNARDRKSYDDLAQATHFLTFDKRLLDTYERLKSRQGI